MGDDLYREKYAAGAEQGDLPGKLKQAVDARFQAGKSGLFVSAGGQQIGSDTTTGGLEVGYEHYSASFLTTHGSLMMFAGIEDLYVGGDVGLRLQAPTRLAPFVGFGTFHGFARETVPANDDGIDNDDDGFIDERGEDEKKFSGWISSVYPETGLHFWLTPDLRLSAVGRYLITTEGRDVDQWWLGGSVAVFSR